MAIQINNSNDRSASLKIEDEILTDKTILEIGCDMGRNTRNLVPLLSGQTSTKLIVTDVSQQHHGRIRVGLIQSNFAPQFIKTDACELDGKRQIIMNY